MHATTWQDLGDMMLSEMSRPQKKRNTVHFHLYEFPRVDRFMDKKQKGGCRRLGKLQYGKIKRFCTM